MAYGALPVPDPDGVTAAGLDERAGAAVVCAGREPDTDPPDEHAASTRASTTQNRMAMPRITFASPDGYVARWVKVVAARSDEGDGWVYWSGLATLAAAIEGPIVAAADQLLIRSSAKHICYPPSTPAN
jgi:hypothetical protein